MSPAERLVESALQPVGRQFTTARWQALRKVSPEDFLVEEIPAYLPSGEGDHLFLWIEKRDVEAMAVAPRLARALDVAKKDIGIAGLKDRRAVTRQFVSVPAACEAAVASGALDALDGMRVLSHRRHRNKLKTGHLRGNHFTIRLRQARPAGDASLGHAANVQSLAALVADFARTGLINAFGQQRFGHRGHTVRLGCSLLGVEGAPPAPRLPSKTLRLALSAVQSALFNAWLRDRLANDTLHRLQAGDVAVVCRSHGPFVVDDAANAAARLQQREVVLGGPLYGDNMLPSQGRAAIHERSLLTRFALDENHFRRFAKLTAGARRPAIVWPEQLQVELTEDNCVLLQCSLPSGAYATEVLDALFDSPTVAAPATGPAMAQTD